MKLFWLGVVVILGLLLGAGLAYVFFGWRPTASLLPTNLESETAEVEKPLSQWAVRNLRLQAITPAQLQLGAELEKSSNWVAYQFIFLTDGKTMSGRVTIPQSVLDQNLTADVPVIVMLRGFVPTNNYVNGAGTNPAARALASQGFVTVVPDYLGYAESDDEYEDAWEGRFRKPLQVAELIRGIQTNGLPISATQKLAVDNDKIGLWAHSNGGQIALTALEILGESIPTTLWAPVTAPFPYSILFFGDEEDDEGLAQRKWISMFDRDYQASDFSFTQHLDLLTGLPLQIHQGLQDEAIHFTWSDEFVNKIKAENKRRDDMIANLSQTPSPAVQATVSANHSTTLLPSPTSITVPPNPIGITYYQYPESNHNMQPNWDTVIQRDIDFFQQHL